MRCESAVGPTSFYQIRRLRVIRCTALVHALVLGRLDQWRNYGCRRPGEKYLDCTPEKAHEFFASIRQKIDAYPLKCLMTYFLVINQQFFIDH